MTDSIDVVKRLQFVYGSAQRNHFDALPKYMQQLMNDEYSPFRAYLETLDPPASVLITISMEVFK